MRILILEGWHLRLLVIDVIVALCFGDGFRSGLELGPHVASVNIPAGCSAPQGIDFASRDRMMCTLVQALLSSKNEWTWDIYIYIYLLFIYLCMYLFILFFIYLFNHIYGCLNVNSTCTGRQIPCFCRSLRHNVIKCLQRQKLRIHLSGHYWYIYIYNFMYIYIYIYVIYIINYTYIYIYIYTKYQANASWKGRD